MVWSRKDYNMTKIIAIASGKGGAGKTTTAINLGLALHNSGKEILVVDGNIDTPHVGLYLGMNKTSVSVHDVLENPNLILNSVNVHSSGLPIMAGDISLTKFKENNYYNIPQFFNKLRGISEMVLLDVGAGLGNPLLKYADDLIVVANPDTISVADALKTIRLAEESNLAVLGVVLNRKRNDGYDMSTSNVEAILGKPVIAEIPESNEVTKSVPLGYPAIHVFPKSDVAKGYGGLASKLVDMYNKEKNRLFR